MKLLFGLLLVLFSSAWRPCAAQTDSAAPSDPPSPLALSHERPVNWLKLAPNISRDQKAIWTFPATIASGHHLKPPLILAGITAGIVAFVDVPSGKAFQRTQSFGGFNRVLSGANTSAAMFIAPSVFYGVSLLRRDTYGQHTFLLAGEAVLDSEVLTTVMKDLDRRMKPVEVPVNGDFGNTWFHSHAGSPLRGIGSFPSGHGIAAFSLGTVFANRYPGRRWHAIAAYGAAAAISLSRVSLQSHHPSDVFAGAFLGYSIAHYVVLNPR
jgi:membrane-associated phospholipid phosphatase